MGAGVVTGDLVDLGGGDYRADLPAMGCGQLVSFTFSAQSTTGITWVDPPNGAGAYQAMAAMAALGTVAAVVLINKR